MGGHHCHLYDVIWDECYIKPSLIISAQWPPCLLKYNGPLVTRIQIECISNSHDTCVPFSLYTATWISCIIQYLLSYIITNKTLNIFM